MWELETMHVAMCQDSGKKKWEVLAFISVDFLEVICRSLQGELDNCCNFDRPRSYLKLAIWRIAIRVLIVTKCTVVFFVNHWFKTVKYPSCFEF